MKNRINFGQRRSRSVLWGLVLPVLFFAAVIGLFGWGIGGISKTADEESLRAAQKAVTKAAVQCYALEGQYPPSISYLQERYGLSIDEKKYIVHYDIFASNIMPMIQVIPRQGQYEQEEWLP